MAKPWEAIYYSDIDAIMKRYKLPVTIHSPGEQTENKYMVEIPTLTGCRAWGDTLAEAMDILQSVAGEFVQSYLEHGEKLPAEVEEAALELVGSKISAEVTIYL